MHQHMPAHGMKASQHREAVPLWRGCMLQTYFTAKGRIDYFIVEEPSLSSSPSGEASRDLEEQAGVVQDVGESRADRVPWLVHTGFPAHMRGLRDAEIQSSYSLPPKKLPGGDCGGEGEDNSDLIRILVAAETVLRDAYKLCSDKSLERKMTQQRAKRLNEFRDAGGSSSGKPGGFRSFKNESSLTSYFRRMKQLLVYYYRVVFCEDGHFTRENEDQVLPRDVIEPTPQQQRAMEGIIDALREQDEMAKEKSADKEDDDERDAELKHAIRNFYVSLICQTVGSRPFRSAVLSFCAMLSRKKAFTRREANDDEQRKRCVWNEPGNFNSNLSALTWTAQLILFDFVCFHKQDDEDGYPNCWRRCAKTSRTAFAKNQARWSLDGQTIDYMGTKLHMEQVSQLVVSEFRQAHSLLYDELLFGANDIAPIEAWRLQDDLDLDDYGGSWLTDERNAEILKGTQDALLRQIEHRAELRGVYVRTDQAGGLSLCPKAMACYEAHVQEFLKRMVTLIHVPPAPPLRAPELLSVTYTNTGRRRCILIWEKIVIVYVRYHKSQEQVGAETENIRFLPRAIRDLLLTYLALVPPLRQVFLRQRKPGALLSPAYARAEVPQFQVAWWRQAAASITKEKFSAKERANFDLEEIAAAKEVEDKAALADLAGMSNHSYRTFNHAYASSTTLTMSTLLHRAYRASQSWRSLFRVDQLLQGKRPHTVSGTQAQGLLNACKKARFRTRPAQKEDGLLKVARRLYNDPGLQLRRPGQRDGMLATLGPRPAEQVIIILATGSGKTLIVMVSATLEGAATTILILPTVALRGNMLVRLGKVALKHYVWSPGSSKSAPLVIMSAEAACTESFLEYANRLADRQRLDRIVIDECHLTITANDYRRCMSQLGWYVRRVQTQTVWLTATLPPDYQELFIEHNKLVRPHIVRESTNRPNIRYIIRRERGLGTLCQRAARLVQTCWTRKDLFESERDKIILYCQTKELVAELADLLGCPSYTADSGTEEERRAVIEQ
ncbi:hypothetical protein MRS44_009687 [Fusarium solani]|uniref:uncharacterized protein n=1 Tax=Fusarium solani TaxID=169388 RepID=UPI0032C47F63|nr:hypothetical protein MRS44_009687 [Fusarium solani]